MRYGSTKLSVSTAKILPILQSKSSLTRANLSKLDRGGRDKFHQVIPITDANGQTIDALSVWIPNDDGAVRLVTAIPNWSMKNSPSDEARRIRCSTPTYGSARV